MHRLQSEATGDLGAVRRCIRWVESAAWDGRHAIALSCDDSIGSGLAGSAAVAVLVGPHASLLVPNGSLVLPDPFPPLLPRSIAGSSVLPMAPLVESLAAAKWEKTVAASMRDVVHIGRSRLTALVALGSLLARRNITHDRALQAPEVWSALTTGRAASGRFAHLDGVQLDLADTYFLRAARDGKREYALTAAITFEYVPRYVPPPPISNADGPISMPPNVQQLLALWVAW